MADIAVFIKHSEIYSEKLSFEDLVALLNKFELTFLLNILIKIDSIFSPSKYKSLEIHEFLLKSLFNDSDRILINNAINKASENGGQVIVFSRQQIENLIRLSIAFNKNSDKISPENSEHLLCQIFLLMNEYYDSLTPQQNDTDGTINYLIRSYLYNNAAQSRKSIVRYYKVFYEIPTQFEWFPQYDWNKYFKKITGVSIEELIAIGFSFLSHWNQINITNLSSYNPFFNKDSYFQNTILDENTISLAFNFFCIDYNRLIPLLLEQIETSENWQLDFDWQNNFPLFEIPSVGIGLHGHRFLINKLTENIYWTLLDNYNDEQKKQYFKHFGKVFEAYACSILRRIFNKKAKIIKYGNNQEVGDCVVDIQRHVFIFEMKSGRLTKNIKLTGDIDQLKEQYTKKLIFRQMKQLDRVIKDFKNDKFKIGNLNFDKVKKIYPIGVTLTEIPQFEWLRTSMEEYKDDNEYFKDDKIQPFQIIDIEELEILEALLTEAYERKYFLELMRQKCGRKRFKDNSFVNMLYDIHGDIIFKIESKTMESAYLDLTDRIKKIVFGRN